MLISKEELLTTSQRIRPFIHQTPVLTSTNLDKLTSAYCFLKCENFQKMGAFKMRGATNAILQLTVEQKENGVATHSSGNFAQALALAAKLNDIKAYIVMPTSAPSVKKEAVLGYGGEVIDCAPTLQAREETLKRVVKETGATFIHPYNDYDVIAGQSTATQELINEYPNLDYIISPIGGGGLISGTALATQYFSPNTTVIGAEPTGADDAYRSLEKGEIVPSIHPNTIADGLLTSLGDKTFPIIKQLVSEIILVEETEIIQAMKFIWERMKLIIEPSSALAVAAAIKNKDQFNGKKVGIIISGGNVDLENLPF
ncbi:MAG: serine dehydratase [Bacteroidetes bacterium]|nr:pyridoxal-phosphate dependent enzyme [Bacteroidia bacterium]PCH68684.1 MAG: serine dehydratase [Bacteroidota bacterium]